MEVSNHLKKFKLLLDYVFEGKVVLNENTTEKLLKFLEDRSDNSPGKRLLETPSFSDVIFESLEKITNASTSVRLFLVEVTSLLFKNELQFIKMQNSHVSQGNQGSSIKYCILHNLSSNIQSRALHLACIKLATVHLTHCSGVKLLLENRVWRYILYPSIYQVSIPIAKAAYKFVSLLVIELNKYEKEEQLMEVLEYVVEPILTSDYNTVEVIDLETEKVLVDKSFTTVTVFCEALKNGTYPHKLGRTQAERDEFMDNVLTNIGKKLTEHLFVAGYAFKPLLESGNTTEIAILSIRELLSLKGHLNATQAGLYFQGLFHILDIYILSDGSGGLVLEENPIKSPNDVRLLSLVLDALRMLLKEHNISWYENVEIVSLQEGLMNLLKQNILETKQIVQVLDLIDLCVKKFLCPNMTLLVEIRQESTLTVIGEVMRTYMHHEDWEVRDSALNLLLTCTDISFIMSSCLVLI
ncbi:hypothetical protein B5X24_HaOG210797 [Helicoverpa armigera]|nr:hypothetical protein B5X24_HaOG210797 [Helicoverpa armigera]